MKYKITITAVLFLIFANSVLGQVPTNNPFHDRSNGIHWTDSLAWKNVINVKDVPNAIDLKGNVDSTIFHDLMKKVSKNGGGVLFFPKGKYFFKYNIHLVNDVILRGADLEGVKKANKKGFRPPTEFLFPKYNPTFEGNGTPKITAFKLIRGENCKNVGIINLDINRGGINYTGENLMIFGIRSNNVANPKFVYLAQFKGFGWQRYPDASSGNIIVTSKRSLIANCRLNDAITDDFEMDNFMTNEGFVFKKIKIKFQYALQQGIKINNCPNDFCKIELYDNYVNSFLAKNIAKNFNGNSILKDNVFINTKCQNLVENDTFYSIPEQKNGSKMFKNEIFINKENDTLAYSILKPYNYDPKKTYPSILFLHGVGQHGINNDHLIHFAKLFSNERNFKTSPYFVIAPHLNVNEKFTSPSLDSLPSKSLKLTMELLESLKSKYSLDPSKITISGISSGSSAVLEVVVRYPDLFKRAIMMSGIRPLNQKQLLRVKNVDFILSAGTDDPYIKIKDYRFFVSIFKNQGLNISYYEYPEFGHWSWLMLQNDEKFLNLIFNNP